MAYQILGTHQITRRRITSADAQSLWNVLSDSRLLPEWVPAVQRVDACEANGERVGAVRHCSVELGGRRGTIVEECVDMAPHSSVTYAVRSDTLGMTTMFNDYCFRISLRGEGGSTEVVIDTYYTPRNLLYALMNAAIMRRQFRGVVDELLAGLCSLAERRGQLARAAVPVP